MSTDQYEDEFWLDSDGIKAQRRHRREERWGIAVAFVAFALLAVSLTIGLPHIVAWAMQ